MRAVVYNGPKDVSADEVPDSVIERGPYSGGQAEYRDAGWTRVVLNPAAS